MGESCPGARQDQAITYPFFQVCFQDHSGMHVDMADRPTISLCGYMVVRKPHLDLFNPLTPSERDIPHLCVDGTWYAGACRKSWCELVEPYYSGSLPTPVRDDYFRVYKYRLGHSTFAVTPDLALARRLMAFCNSEHDFNDLIAIDVPEIGDAYRFEASSDGLTLLGYDIVLRGGWSLLLEGYFFRPHLFQTWSHRINRNGLFAEDALIPEYVRDYVAASAENLTDPIDGYGDEIDRVAVYQVVGDKRDRSNIGSLSSG